jgi:hypothetical protein
MFLSSWLPGAMKPVVRSGPRVAPEPLLCLQRVWRDILCAEACDVVNDPQLLTDSCTGRLVFITVLPGAMKPVVGSGFTCASGSRAFCL